MRWSRHDQRAHRLHRPGEKTFSTRGERGSDRCDAERVYYQLICHPSIHGLCTLRCHECAGCTGRYVRSQGREGKREVCIVSNTEDGMVGGGAAAFSAALHPSVWMAASLAVCLCGCVCRSIALFAVRPSRHVTLTCAAQQRPSIHPSHWLHPSHDTASHRMTSHGHPSCL